MPLDSPARGLSIGRVGWAQLLLCVLFSLACSSRLPVVQIDPKGGVTKRGLFAGLIVTGPQGEASPPQRPTSIDNFQ